MNHLSIGEISGVAHDFMRFPITMIVPLLPPMTKSPK